MGSLMVEPDKILDSNSPFSTIKVACISIEKLASSSGGIFFHRNPLTYQTPLMMLQLSLASVVIMLTAFLLKPLGQPLMASQMLGGIILGPSFLGQKASIRNALFPTASLVMLDLLAVFGVMFYFFLVGVQMDPWIIKKSGKKSMAIGIAVVISSLTFSAFSYILVMAFMHPDPMSSHSIPFTGAAEAMVTFPAIAFFLSELKILNSDFGRLALSSSMVSGLVGAVLFTTTFLKPSSHRTDPSSIHKFATAIVLAMVIFFVFRPAVLWKIRRCSKGETVTQGFIYSILVTVLVTGFISQYVGHHVMFGPFFLGMVIPAGPPLGSALVKRLEIIISGMLLPLYFVKNGLITDVFAVRWTQFVVVEFVILFGCVGKFLGAFLPALYCRMPLRDAISLGLIMNVQGVLELTIFRMMKRKQIIDDESFVTMCLSMVLVTGVITPLVKALYDPSRRYAVYKRRTIQHSKPNTELRVLMCIHNEQRIPAMINLLEASNHTKENPINVYVLHLIELVGSAAPLLISHELWTRPSNANLSEHVVGAFRHYELDNQDTITVHSFTSVAPYASMHDDVCTLALNKRTSLIVVPFHKHWATNGPLESFDTGLRTVNSNVLDKAPCSVAILVDRGLFSDSRSALENWTPFCVAVLFLGGADDRETLAYGARMAEHLKVNLTVVRFLQDQNETSDGRETKLDDHVVNEFKLKMVGNERVTYKEEVVMDGLGTLGVIHSMEGDYQLFMVGRRHEKQSTLISGLTEWDECTELGTIGDLLASSDFRGNATVLVVQQQANVVPGLLDNLESPNLSARVTRDVLEEEAEELPIQRREA